MEKQEKPICLNKCKLHRCVNDIILKGECCEWTGGRKRVGDRVTQSPWHILQDVPDGRWLDLCKLYLKLTCVRMKFWQKSITYRISPIEELRNTKKASPWLNYFSSRKKTTKSREDNRFWKLTVRLHLQLYQMRLTSLLATWQQWVPQTGNTTIMRLWPLVLVPSHTSSFLTITRIF